MHRSTAFPLLLCAATSLFLVATAQAPQAAGYDNYGAAACCARGPRCWPEHATMSRLCEGGRWMSSQSRRCQQAACRYCYKSASRRAQPVCRSIPILKNCFNRRAPFPQPPPSFQIASYSPTPSPSPQQVSSPTSSSSSPSTGRCSVYTTRNGVLNVPASLFPERRLWIVQQNPRSKRIGATYRPDITNDTIYGPGTSGGSFCVRFSPRETSRFYFTSLSSAPHPTDHNDAWFALRPSGVALFSPQRRKVLEPRRGWLKGYQNEGRNAVANYIQHIDYNGHQLVTPVLLEGRSYEVCVAGRSSKFTLYNIILVACGSTNENWTTLNQVSSCSRFGSRVRSKLANLPKTVCA